MAAKMIKLVFCGLAVLLALVFGLCSALPTPKEDASKFVMESAGSIWDYPTERFITLKELGDGKPFEGVCEDTLFTREHFAQFLELEVEGSFAGFADEDELNELVAHTVLKFWRRTAMNTTHVCIDSETMQAYFAQHSQEGQHMRRLKLNELPPAMKFVRMQKEEAKAAALDTTMRGTGGPPPKPGYSSYLHDWGTSRQADITKCKEMFWHFSSIVFERAGDADTRYPHYYSQGDSIWAQPPKYCAVSPTYGTRECKVILLDGTVLKTIPGIQCVWFKTAFSELNCASTACNFENLFKRMCTFLDRTGVIFDSYADSFCYSSLMSYIEPFQTRAACMSGYQVYYLLDHLVFGSYAQNQYWYDNNAFFGNMLSHYTPYEKHCL